MITSIFNMLIEDIKVLTTYTISHVRDIDSFIYSLYTYPRSKEYCFFFQIPLNKLLSLNFLSVESAISLATESSSIAPSERKNINIFVYLSKNRVSFVSLKDNFEQNKSFL